MTRISLCSGLLLRGDCVLLVRTVYPGEPKALWTLPGGRQETGETIAETVVREFREETSLDVRIGPLAYVSESVDDSRGLHVVNCTFWVTEPDPSLAVRSQDRAVVEIRFVPAAQAPELLRADVLRIPVAAALSGQPGARYFSFKAADIRVPFFSSTPAAAEG